MSEQDPIRIVLTPEQRALVHRLSGQHVEAIDLESDATPAGDAPQSPAPVQARRAGGPLTFRWRLSTASGIPRQAWMVDDSLPAPETENPAS